MNIVLWVLGSVLAAVMLGAGLLKATQSKARIQESMGERMAWMDDYSPTQIRLIGTAEVVGAVGVVVPEATGILPVLTPIAALCLGVLMLGAARAHDRRGETEARLTPLALALLAFFVAIGRFAT